MGSLLIRAQCGLARETLGYGVGISEPICAGQRIEATKGREVGERTMRHMRYLLVLILTIHTTMVSAFDGEDSTVDFARDVVPLLAKNCVACHNEKRAEGGLNLGSHAALMLGGDSGAAIESGKPDEGYFLARIMDDDDPMPPLGNSVGANRMTEPEIELLRKWILAGAQPSEPAASSHFGWQPLPESVHPIYALATSADGNYVAFGRGNQSFVMRQGATDKPDEAFALIDPTVSEVLRQTNPNSVNGPATQAAHLDIVQSIAFSPDSQWIATGGYRSVKLWQRQTSPVDSLSDAISFTTPPTVVAISPDRRRLAAASENIIEIVDLRSGLAMRLLKTHLDRITALAWLDGGTDLISVDTGGVYMLTSSQSGLSQRLSGENLAVCSQLERLAPNRFVGIAENEKLVELTIHTDTSLIEVKLIESIEGVATLSVSSEGPIVALGGADGKCRIINGETWELIQEIATSGPIQELAIDSDGKWIATVHVDNATNTPGLAEVWRVEDGTKVATLDRDYEFSGRIATAQRNTVRQEGVLTRLSATLEEFKKAAEAEETARAKVEEARNQAATDLEAKKAAIETAATEVTNAENALADAEAAVAEAMKLVESRKAELEAKRKAVETANAQRDQAGEELAKREQSLAAANDGASRAAAKVPETEQSIQREQQRLMELQQERDQLTSHPAAKPRARLVEFSSDGSRVLVADDSARVQLFHTSDGTSEAVWQADASLSALAASAEGTVLGLSSAGTITMWNINLPWELKRTIGTFEESPWSDRITALDFSPDGKLLAVGSGPASRFGEISIVDVGTGEMDKTFGQVHSDSVLALKFSPDGRLLASGSADKNIRIFDVATGQAMRALEGHTHHVLALSWKDDAVTLATGSADNTVKLWDVELGTQSRTVGGFKKEVTSLAFVGQTGQFVAVDASGTAQLIEAADGKQIRSFAGADGAIMTVGIGANGKHLYAGGQSGSTWIWQVEDGAKVK